MDLIAQYEEDRMVRLKLSGNTDFVKERKLENLTLFQNNISHAKIDTKRVKEVCLNNNVVIPAENYFRPSARQ